jgi:Fe-S-cluster containining protein
MTNPCATCTRRCCHHYLVTVTGYDAWVIASGLRMAPEQFLVAVPQQTTNGRGFLLEAEGPTFEIALDKAAARTKEKPCVFWLGLPSGGGRCGIYSLRPFVCQTYPAFMQDGLVQRREDVLCPGTAWRDGTLQHPVWRDRVCRMQVELDLYSRIVERWNAHINGGGLGSILGYYAYLMHVYERLNPVRRSVGDEEWVGVAEAWSAALQGGISPLISAVPTMARWQEVLNELLSIVALSIGRGTERVVVPAQSESEPETLKDDRFLAGEPVSVSAFT